MGEGRVEKLLRDAALFFHRDGTNDIHRFRALKELFPVRPATTAGETAPRSGSCERHCVRDRLAFPTPPHGCSQVLNAPGGGSGKRGRLRGRPASCRTPRLAGRRKRPQASVFSFVIAGWRPQRSPGSFPTQPFRTRSVPSRSVAVRSFGAIPLEGGPT
jgi:hypothetical protein